MQSESQNIEYNYPTPTVKEIDGGVSVWIKRFSLEELVVRNKKRYGEKVPNMRDTDMKNVGKNVGNMSVMKLTERQRYICSMILENPYITVKEMSVTMSVTKRTVERDLAAMSHLVKHEGAVNGGKWILLKDITQYD